MEHHNKETDGNSVKMNETFHSDSIPSQSSLSNLTEFFDDYFEKMANTIYESANDLFYVHDLAGNILTINRATQEAFGYSREEFLKLRIVDVIAAEDLDLAKDMTEKKILGEAERTSYELNCIGKNKQKIVLEINSSIIYQDGKPIAVQGIARNITERKAMQNALQENEEYLQMLFDNANDLIYIFDLNGRFISHNIAVEKAFGYSKEELESKHLSELVAPESLEKTNKLFEQRSRGIEGEAVEIAMTHKDGSRFFLEVNNSPVFKDGKVVAIQGIARDITEKKELQSSLIESENRNRTLFENSRDVIYIIGLDKKVLSVNPIVEKVFGFTPNEILESKNFLDFVTPEDKDKTYQLFQNSINGIETDAEEIVCRRKDGSTFFFETKMNAIFLNGKLIGVQGMGRDVTERKEAAKKIAESEAEMRSLFAAMNDLVLVFDKEGRYLKAPLTNNQNLLYKPSDELIGKKLHEIFPEEQADFFLSGITEALKKQSSVDIDYALEIEGGKVYFSSIISPVNEDSVIIVARDISEQKTAEMDLEEREQFLTSVTNAAKDAIVSADSAGNIIFWNDAAETIFGYEKRDVIGKSLTLLMPEAFRQRHTDGMKRYQETNEKRVIGKIVEMPGLRKDGTEIPIELSLGNWETPKGKYFVGVMRDLTAQKAAQDSVRENEEKYRELFENANDIVFTLNMDGNFTTFNKAGEEITGYSRSEILQMSLKDLTAKENLDLITKNTKVLLLSKKPITYELKLVSKDGKPILLEISTRLIERKGIAVGIQGIGRDITERKAIEENLRKSERQYRLLSEGIGHIVWTATPKGKVEYLNERGLRYFGKPLRETAGEYWKTLIHPDDKDAAFQKWNFSIHTGEVFETEFRLRRFDGKYRWHRSLGIPGKDKCGNVISWFGTDTDIHDQKTAEEQLIHLARHDVLTGLPNRFKFVKYLERVVNITKLNPKNKFAVFFLDIDRFKLINDSLGHFVGDQLLSAFAERLEENTRLGDVIARLGGDEFTILLNNLTDINEAAEIAKRLIQSFLIPFNVNGYEVFASASIGIVFSDDSERTAIDVLRDADAAMYRAKESGKSCYEIFNCEIHAHNINLLQTENSLRRAIERNEFRVYYQPIISLETGELNSFEALIRWHHPERGLITPADFIEIAEETGLIIPIGKWILDQACRQVAEWQTRFPHAKPFRINVNLSTKQLMHTTLISDVSDILTKHQLNAKYLELEVTESAIMKNEKVCFSVLENLKKLGVLLSTDDFGTGYSSLSYLHQFPFDTLKIDRSFINKMNTGDKADEIVCTILSLAQSLNLKVVAEGIETEEQLRKLQDLKCDYGQGYLFSKPVVAQVAESFLDKNLHNFDIVVPSFYKTYENLNFEM